jgi:hypothetical protein
MDALPILVAAVAVVAVIVWLILRFRRTRAGMLAEPSYVLEKLVNCMSCGSLIPEGVRKCAFCGAWQRETDSSADKSGS